MALSTFDQALGAYILGRTLPKGTTRKAFQAAVVAAIRTGQAVAPYAARGLVAAAPPIARAVANPYIGGPLAVGAGGYALQQYAEESGFQDEQTRLRDEFLASLEPTAKRIQKKKRSLYNRAVSKAMKAVKASIYDGKKGTLRNPKKTFGTVSKTVSKVMKGKKVPRVRATGLIKRTIEKAFPGLVRKPKRKRIPKAQYTFRTD